MANGSARNARQRWITTAAVELDKGYSDAEVIESLMQRHNYLTQEQAQGILALGKVAVAYGKDYTAIAKPGGAGVGLESPATIDVRQEVTVFVTITNPDGTEQVRQTRITILPGETIAGLRSKINDIIDQWKLKYNVHGQTFDWEIGYVITGE